MNGGTDGRIDGWIVSAASGKPDKIPGVTYNGLSSHTGGVAILDSKTLHSMKISSHGVCQLARMQTSPLP